MFANITAKLADYQKPAAPKTLPNSSAISTNPKGVTQTPSPTYQSVMDSAQHAQALQTLSDPNFWRARALNRMGISKHDDPNVSAYLSQMGGSQLPAMAAGAVGTLALTKILG